jgi:hypothetical protein
VDEVVCNWHGIGMIEGDVGWSCPMCPNPNNLNRHIERLSAEVADLKRGINWHTECLNCAKLMDDNYGQFVEIERLRAQIESMQASPYLSEWFRLVGLVDRLAEALEAETADPERAFRHADTPRALRAWKKARHG